jgi:ribosomal protein L11 methyltransferase
VGVDNDPRAIATARANARRNRIAKAKFQVADARQWRPAGKMNVVTANLYSELLIDTLPQFRRYLAADGFLIISGIMRGQERAVIRALRASAIELVELRRRGKWIAFLARPRP